MKKSQWIAIVLFSGLFLFLLLGFRTKPKTLTATEQERSMNMESANVDLLKQEAIKDISKSGRTRIQVLESQLNDTVADSLRINQLQELASIWYDEGHPLIAGTYAESIAQLENKASSWSIAGTTFALSIKTSQTEKEKQYSISHALNALETAESIDPKNVSYSLNRAIILAENPPTDNPMRGVLMLLDLNKKHPKNVSVINNIAKFALQTGQLEKAEQRLLTAESILPNNKTTNCLFAQLYEAKGDISKADAYRTKCEL